ncbi:DUF2637 domain-containing protein [Amycolatopsis samaneae]|uniref:DUF2637 domain-containing protein n=2 Tax=Amycolatopsis samaneae TaxID=664691 RepID=UPI0031EDE2A0
MQCACTALVALGAAYASYRHGREFAFRFGADQATAAIWPLIVDGLLTTATVELWKPHHGGNSRWAAWLAFLFGITLSLCANIGAAPTLNVLSIAVAACPPLALLLAVELLNRALKRHRTETTARTPRADETDTETHNATRLTVLPAPTALPSAGHTAEERMWTHYKAQRLSGHTPTGAELELPPVRRTRRVWGQAVTLGGVWRASNVTGACIPMLE